MKITEQEYAALMLRRMRRLAPPGPSHADILKAVRDVLRLCRYDHYKNFGGPIGEKGLPDITALEPKTGRYIGLEVKAGKDKMNEFQIRWRERILRSGGMFIEVRDIDDVIDGLGVRERFLQL